MANYQILKADIDEKVYENAQQKITGTNLNSVLNAMVTTLGAEYQFAGVATKDTNPGTPDAKVFYIANGKGTYTNFGDINVTEDEVVVLYWGSSWHKEATGIASQEKLTELEQEVIDINGFDYILYVDTEFSLYTLPFTIKNGSKVRNTGTASFYLVNSEESVVSVMGGQVVTVPFDATILKSSSTINLNYSLHIYGTLEGKQDNLTFDNTPTENSNNPVTSNGVYNFVEDAIKKTGLEENTLSLESNYDGYYISSGGGKYEGQLYTISKPFHVKKGDVIRIIGKASDSVSLISYYNTSDDTYEVVKLGNNANEASEYLQTLPKDGLIVICMMTDFFSQSTCSIYRLPNILTKDSSIINLYDPSTAIDNYHPNIWEAGDVEDINYLCSDYIYIKGYSVITIPYFALMSTEPYIPYYDAQKTYINKITGTQHGELAEFTIPSSAFYIRVPNRKYKNLEENIINNPCTFMCINGTYDKYPSRYVKYGEVYDFLKEKLQTDTGDNPLYGKKVVFTGDSICNGDSDIYSMDSPIFSTIGHGWPVRIGTKNQMLWTNKGVSGGTITDSEIVGSSFTISDTDFGNNPDYIIMEGGTNDADRVGSILDGNIPEKFGSYTLASNYNDTFDNTTFCGAVEYMFQRVMKNYPHAKKGFIIAHKMGLSSAGYNAEVNNRRAYFEVIIALCKKWGIPYIDLWETAPMCPMLPEHYTWQQTKLYSGGTPEKQDGQHPTADGYDILSPMIEAWMKTL